MLCILLRLVNVHLSTERWREHKKLLVNKKFTKASAYWSSPASHIQNSNTIRNKFLGLFSRSSRWEWKKPYKINVRKGTEMVEGSRSECHYVLYEMIGQVTYFKVTWIQQWAKIHKRKLRRIKEKNKEKQ